MIRGMISSCAPCPFHDLVEEEGVFSSHCRKENCWARFSKCVRNKALARFLEEQCAVSGRGFPAPGPVRKP
ncbi:MAG: hypothetical protein ACUVS3_08730 [Thermodesulfobacteriota bacterium]